MFFRNSQAQFLTQDFGDKNQPLIMRNVVIYGCPLSEQIFPDLLTLTYYQFISITFSTRLYKDFGSIVIRTLIDGFLTLFFEYSNFMVIQSKKWTHTHTSAPTTSDHSVFPDTLPFDREFTYKVLTFNFSKKDIISLVFFEHFSRYWTIYEICCQPNSDIQICLFM